MLIFCIPLTDMIIDDFYCDPFVPNMTVFENYVLSPNVNWVMKSIKYMLRIWSLKCSHNNFKWTYACSAMLLVKTKLKLMISENNFQLYVIQQQNSSRMSWKYYTNNVHTKISAITVHTYLGDSAVQRYCMICVIYV